MLLPYHLLYLHQSRFLVQRSMLMWGWSCSVAMAERSSPGLMGSFDMSAVTLDWLPSARTSDSKVYMHILFFHFFLIVCMFSVSIFKLCLLYLLFCLLLWYDCVIFFAFCVHKGYFYTLLYVCGSDRDLILFRIWLSVHFLLILY